MKDLEKYVEWCKEKNLNPMEVSSMFSYNKENKKKKETETIKLKDLISDLLDEEIPVSLKKQVKDSILYCINSAKEAKEFGDFVAKTLLGE